MKNLLTLHQAIALALLDADKRTLSFAAIAAYIEKKQLFPERKGNISLQEQVMLRATKCQGRYAYLFEKVGADSIRLRNLNAITLNKVTIQDAEFGLGDNINKSKI